MQIINDKKWLNYRLGDFICGFSKLSSHEYKGSIAQQYICQNNKHPKVLNIKLLDKIVNNHAKTINIPEENIVILNLRIGDVIRKYKDGIYFFHRQNKPLKQNGVGGWGTTLESIKELFDSQSIPIESTIVLCYGSHKKINCTLSKNYIKDVEKILEKNNYKFETHNGNNPDDDFTFMCKSKTFIQTRGGFSRLISKIVSLNGGTVILPKYVK